MLPESFPIPPRLFKVLYALIHNVDLIIPASDIEYLLADGCITAKLGGGWLVNSKGRLYWRKYRRHAAVHDAIVAEMPIDTILRLKACEYNHSPMLNAGVIDGLVRAGYLLQPPAGGVLITPKGYDLLRSYNRILMDLK